MKTKGKNIIILLLILGLICGVSFLGINGATVAGYKYKSYDEAITKGLDLQGGVSVLMEIQSDEVSEEQLNRVKELLALRVNTIGVAETVVTTEGDKRVRVDIPGQYDSSSVVDTLTKTGELKFVGPDETEILTGADVEEAKSALDQQTSQPVISLKLNEDGKTKFADATQKYMGQQISIVMDDQVLTSPTVQAVITNGEAVITGNRSYEEAERIAGVINAGALPVPVKQVSITTVGAQLGENALPNALKAGAIGISLVFLLMILYYRVPGIISCFSLTLFINLVLLAFANLSVTITLPGIAALLLTIGMAVDANILIFERTREELKKGKGIKTSVDEGFKNAMSSIIDSNSTTLIAGLVLYFLGTGSVKGFAVTLIVGIVASIFTAIFVTKYIMKLMVEIGWLNKLSLFRVKGGKKDA